MHKLYLAIAYLISILIPRSRKIWVFGENELSVLRPFFEFSSKYDDGIKKIYISKNNIRVSKLRSQGFCAIHAYSFIAFYYIARSKLHFICKSKLSDLHSLLSVKAIKINLFHGTPLKAVGLAAVNNRKNTFFKNLRSKKLKKRYSKYLFLCATSSYTQKIYSKCFGVSQNKLKIIGHPRNDLIANKSTDRKFININAKKNLEGYRMIFSYMPTWRKYDWDNEINYHKLNRFLVSKNSILYIRPHHLDKNFKGLQNYSNIIVYSYDNSSIYDSHCDLLGTDVLITDYSSLTYDFLLTKRPILIYTPDYHRYKKTTKFSVNFLQNIPYPATFNSSDLINNLETILDNKYDYEKYIETLNLYHHFQDDNSCARLYKEAKAICHYKG